MHRFRAVVKRCIAYGLYYSGVLWVYAAFALRHRAVVLMYHRVLPPDADSFSDTGIVVTPETFAANMRFLKQHFSPLSAAEFRACLDRRHFPQRACHVTFDDGWQDNDKVALPILRSLDLPAVFFIATGYVGSKQTFWQERLTRCLFGLSRTPETGKEILAEFGIADACMAGDLEARRIVRDFVTRLKSSSVAEIERVAVRASRFAEETGRPALVIGDDAFLDWSAVARISASGLVTIGSHAHSHIPLTRLGRDGATADLLESLREIERHAIPLPWMCAYPNGDYDANVLECLEQAGLTMGFTTEHGYVDTMRDSRRLPRINVHESAAGTPPEFLCRILGLF